VTGTKKWFRRRATMMVLAAMAICGGQVSLARAQDISKSVQYGGMETTSKVLNSTNSSEVDTYASAVITDYALWYEGYWAAVEADLYDNGAWIDYNVGDDGFASATTRLSDPINIGHRYDAVATSGLCWWEDEGDFGYEEYCSAVYQLDLYGILGKPQISSINPSGGTIGKSGSITVQGQNLVDPFSGNASAAITGSGVTLTVQSNPSDSQVGLNFTIASNATAGNQTLTLNNRFGTSNGETFTVGYPPAVVSNVSPSVWTAGQSTSVTITGTGFGNQPTISVNGTGVSLMLNSASPDGTTIHATATVNLAAASQSVTVTVQPGYAGQNFMCNCPPDQAKGTDTATIQPVTPAPQIRMVSNQSDLASCQSGSVVSGSGETDVFAGQQMLLCAAPPPTGFSIVNQYWEFEKIVDITGGFTNAAGTGQPSGSGGGSEAADPNLAQNGIKFYFVNPGTVETATYHWTLSNGDGNGNSATADFNIQGPTGNLLPNAFAQSDITGTSLSNAQGQVAQLSMTKSPMKPGVGVFINDNAQPVANSGQCPPRVGAPPAAGCGQFVWVQILKSVTQLQIIPLGDTFTPSNASNQLDGTYPYAFAGPPNATWDSPGRGLLHGWGEGAEPFSATMYVLWDPALPANCVPAWTDTAVLPGNPYIPHASTCTSVPIPLGSVQWSWSACAINALAAAAGGGTTPNWNLYCGTGSGNSAGDASGYPEWSSGTGPGGCFVSDNGKCQ